MVRSCVATISEKNIPDHTDRVMIRKTMPDAGEAVIIKLYSSEGRFRNEVRKNTELWNTAGAGLKPFLGTPYFGAKVTTEAVNEFFAFNAKKKQVEKNRDALKLHSGDTFAFKVKDCETTLATNQHSSMFMIVSPQFDMDLRTLLSKKHKSDKIVALHKTFHALAKLNEKLIHADTFVDNIMFHEEAPKIIDLDYSRDVDRLYARPERPQRFGAAELIVPETVAFSGAFETAGNAPSEVVEEERVARVYHPKIAKGELKQRVEGYSYAHPEGKTRTEWMRDAATMELATLHPKEQVMDLFKQGGVSDVLKAAFVAPPEDPSSIYADGSKNLKFMRDRYDAFKLALSVHLLHLESGHGIEPRDALFMARLLRGLTHPDITKRLSAAEADMWFEAYVKARPAEIKKAPVDVLKPQAVAPLPRPGRNSRPPRWPRLWTPREPGCRWTSSPRPLPPRRHQRHPSPRHPRSRRR